MQSIKCANFALAHFKWRCQIVFSPAAAGLLQALVQLQCGISSTHSISACCLIRRWRAMFLPNFGDDFVVLWMVFGKATAAALLHVGHPLALGHARELDLLALLQLEGAHVADCRAKRTHVRTLISPVSTTRTACSNISGSTPPAQH